MEEHNRSLGNPCCEEQHSSLGNPYDANTNLEHNSSSPQILQKTVDNENSVNEDHQHDDFPKTEEDMMDRAVENAVIRAIFNNNEIDRRRFMKMVGASTAAAVIASIFPLKAAKAIAKEGLKGGLETKDLTLGFIPITCATPIIMSEPMGFYKKNGLNAKVRKASGWAMVRDWAINKDVQAAHMLSPMPLSITMGEGSKKVPFFMPAVENINGQAITLANKHKGVKTAKDMKGFRFCVPFEYSMHNFLLRYFLAEGGVHPDKLSLIHI